MGDKKQIQAQIDKLVALVNELEKRELAISRESKYLEELKLKLDEQESGIAAAKAAKPGGVLPVREVEEPGPVYREKPLSAPPSAPQNASQSARPSVRPPFAAPVKPAAMPETRSAEIVAEINEILKSVFWDYSASVHQISSQISTITAAMMCAAVTCILENRGFDAKDVFLQEMQKMLQNGALGNAGAKQPEKSSRPEQKPAPKPAPESKPVYTSAPVRKPEPELINRQSITEPVNKPAPAPAPEPVSGQAPKPAPEPVSRARYLDADELDDETYGPVDSAAAMPRQTGGGIMRIGSVIEFQKLGEYGLRNNDQIIRVELPEGIQYLPVNFFYGCRNLKEVWLPDSLLEIGSNSLYGCESLLAVHFGDASALREIGEYAFAMCRALASFTVPPLVETLGTSVFRFCSSLERVYFSKESKLQAIGSHLLQNCTSLDKVRLPDSVTVIPTSMFYGCSNLRRVVAKGVDTIEDFAFYGNESLRTVSIRSKKAISPQAFEGCDPALVIEYLNY